MRPLCATDIVKCPTSLVANAQEWEIFLRHPVHIQLSKDVVTLLTLQGIPDNGSLLTNVQFRQSGSDIAEHVFSSNRCCVFLQEVPNFPDIFFVQLSKEEPIQDHMWHIRRAILMEKHLYSFFCYTPFSSFLIGNQLNDWSTLCTIPDETLS